MVARGLRGGGAAPAGQRAGGAGVGHRSRWRGLGSARRRGYAGDRTPGAGAARIWFARRSWTFARPSTAIRSAGVAAAGLERAGHAVPRRARGRGAAQCAGSHRAGAAGSPGATLEPGRRVREDGGFGRAPAHHCPRRRRHVRRHPVRRHPAAAAAARRAPGAGGRPFAGDAASPCYSAAGWLGADAAAASAGGRSGAGCSWRRARIRWRFRRASRGVSAGPADIRRRAARVALGRQRVAQQAVRPPARLLRRGQGQRLARPGAPPASSCSCSSASWRMPPARRSWPTARQGRPSAAQGARARSHRRARPSRSATARAPPATWARSRAPSGAPPQPREAVARRAPGAGAGRAATGRDGAAARAGGATATTGCGAGFATTWGGRTLLGDPDSPHDHADRQHRPDHESIPS